MSKATDAVMNQVSTVLDLGGLAYDVSDEKILVSWAGADDDQNIGVALWSSEDKIVVGDETYTVPILLVQAPLVVDFELTPKNLAFALLACNEFNESALMKMRVQFPKPNHAATIEEAATGESKGWIYMEAEIVATDLEQREIIILLFALKDTADAIDDLIAGTLGGKTLVQFYRDDSPTGGLTLDI